tara:strand:- start:493 stop:2166 length:1674 start_codon:yes stop_codon:yes gene_type:complete
MFLRKNYIIGIIIILLSTTNGNTLISNQKFLYSSEYIKNYLYGSILHQSNQHNLAAKNLFKINKLKGKHSSYDIKNIISLVINGNINQAANIIQDVDKIYSDIFILDFIKAIYLIKINKSQQAVFELNNIKNNDPIFMEMINNLKFWIQIKNKNIRQKVLIKNFKSNYPSIKLINQFLSSRYIENSKLYKFYDNEILNSDALTRYKILSAWNYIRDEKNNQAFDMLNSLLKIDGNNLLLKQSILDIKYKKYKFISFFDPKKFNHNLSEIFYLYANLYQQRGDKVLFEMLLSISIDFNKKFLSNNLIDFEQKVLNYDNFKFNYLFLSNLKNIGSEYKWYINYQLAARNKKNISILVNSINLNDYFLKEKYFDLGNYYRLNKNYELALDFYKKIEKLQPVQNWTYYYYVGICYERLKQWKKSEEYLKKSLTIAPQEYSVINYLAYSWLERRENIEEATMMLKNAVELSKWEKGYIIDSLGWAYFLKKDFDKAEKLLKIAYEKNTNESEVYDHYGDVLWMQKKFLQARYVWNNAINLENIDSKRKKNIKNKIINGLIPSD